MHHRLILTFLVLVDFTVLQHLTVLFLKLASAVVNIYYE